MNRNLVHHAADTIGVAYYGVLALYAIYEFITWGEYVSIAVIAPLFYALVIYGVLFIIISLFYVYDSRLVKERRKDLLETARTTFGLGVVSILAAGGLALEYSQPEERVQLYGTPSLIFVIITVGEILLRIFFSYPPQPEDEIGFSKTLDRVTKAYPMGWITFFGFFFGRWFITALSASPENLFTEEAMLAIAFYFLIIFFTIDRLNKKALRWWKKQQPYQRSSLSSKLKFLSSRHPSQPRLWSFLTTFLLTAIFTLLAYFYFGQLFSQITSKRLLLLLFTAIYGFQSWYMWREIKG